MNNEEYGPNMSPENNLEMNMLMTNPVWGSDEEVNKSFINKVTKSQVVEITTADGKKTIQVEKDKLWEHMQMFTRDLRLGNLSRSQITYCDYFLRLAGDLLDENYVSAFVICMNRVASVLELSQSYDGFLRKQMKTTTREQKESIENVKKGGIFHQGVNKNY